MRIALFVALLCTACGARTALTEGEPCADAGTRACETGCGPGVQACVAGAWTACAPSVTERPCEDACGAGTERCVGDAWTACAVPPVERACEATCGPGTQSCADGAWSACRGPATSERVCENACGEGVEACADDAWGPCEVPPVERACEGECGEGVERCVAGRWGPCVGSMPRPPSLTVVVRDFSSAHPDFESFIGDDRGIVEPILGADDKPVYAGPSPSTNGRAAFDEWYRDVPGVNERVEIDLPLAPSPSDPSLFVFEDAAFFPIDGRLLGDEGRAHNFHFTLEATGTFVYAGGETFRFSGDDDVFVFIDRRLVIDLGGVHGTQEATVALDTLGLVPGERYALHLFFAERHTEASTFAIETSVSDPITCD